MGVKLGFGEATPQVWCSLDTDAPSTGAFFDGRLPDGANRRPGLAELILGGFKATVSCGIIEVRIPTDIGPK